MSLLERRAHRKGWSPEKLAAKLERRDKVKTKLKGIGGNVLQPLASAALNTLPFGAVAANALNKIVDKVPVLRETPVLRQVVEEGADQWKVKVMTSGGIFGALMTDMVPAQEYIENGEWLKAIASYGLLLTAAAVVIFPLI